MASSDRSAYFYENTRWRLLFSLTWIVLLLVGLVALLGLGGATHSRFFTAGNFRLLVDQFLVIALLAPAMVMIVGAGGLDLSVGAVMGLAGVVFCAAAGRGAPVPSAAILGLGAALLVGLVNGSLVGLARIPGIVVTFATTALAAGIAAAVSGGTLIPLADPARQELAGLPLLAWGLLFVVGIGSILLVQLTPFGRRPSPGPAEESEPWPARACFTGLPYLLSALMAGLGGLLAAHRIGAADPAFGSRTGMGIIGVVILGGTCLGGRFGSVIGALLAAFMFVLLENVLIFLDSAESVRDIVLAAVFLGGAVLIHGSCSLTQSIYRRRLRNT